MSPQPLQLFLQFHFLFVYIMCYSVSELCILHWQQPPVLLCWPTKSEVDVGGMAVEDEPSHQYPTPWLCDRRQQRGSLTQWCLTWKCMWSKGVSLNPSMQKKWHPMTLIDACWMFMETKQWMWAQWDVCGVFQQWWWWQWVTSTGADFYKHSMQALVHCWWECIANGGYYVKNSCFLFFFSWEFALSNTIIVLFVSIVVSMEIKRRHYFQRNLYTFL